MQTDERYLPDREGPDAVYTPREKREAVVIYRSVLEAAQDADTPEEGNRVLRELLECSFGCKALADVPNPYRMIIRPMMASIDKASERHDRCVAAGRQGGRPRTELDRETVEQAYAALGSWDRVADQLGVSRKTLYDARRRWDDGDLGKNLTNTNTNTKTNTNTNTTTNTTARPSGRSALARRAAEREKKKSVQRNDLERARRMLQALREEREDAAAGGQKGAFPLAEQSRSW